MSEFGSEKNVMEYIEKLFAEGRLEEIGQVLNRPEAQEQKTLEITLAGRILNIYDLQREDGGGHILMHGKTMGEIVEYYKTLAGLIQSAHRQRAGQSLLKLISFMNRHETGYFEIVSIIQYEFAHEQSDRMLAELGIALHRDGGAPIGLELVEAAYCLNPEQGQAVDYLLSQQAQAEAEPASQDEQLPLVSVIIPTYNREKVIGRSINSVLNQTYQNFEIIVIDDCSQDDTETVINAYQDNRIHYVRNERNLGAAGSRNAGMKLAQGEYIAFQDSDDEWHPGKLEKQIRAIEADTETAEGEAGMVYCQAYKELGGMMRRFPAEDTPMEYKTGNILSTFLFVSLASTQTIMIKKKVWEEIGGFHEELKNLEEWEYCIRIAEKFRIVFVNEPLVTLYYSDNNISGNHIAGMKTEFYILKRIEQYLTTPELIKVKMDAILERSYRKESKALFQELLFQYVDHLLERKRYEEAAALFTIPECRSDDLKVQKQLNKVFSIYEIQKGQTRQHILTKGRNLKKIFSYYRSQVQKMEQPLDDQTELMGVLQLGFPDGAKLGEAVWQRFQEKNTRPPVVSVILPVCGTNSKWQKTAESIRSQSYSDWELIIVGHEWDKITEEGLKEYDDNRIRYIRNDERLGLIEAGNHGADSARGQYLAFAYPGDTWNQDRLSKQVSVFTMNGDEPGLPVGIVWCGCSSSGIPDERMRQDVLHQLIFEPAIAAQTMLIDRRLWKSAGGFLPERGELASWDFCLGALLDFKILTVDEILVEDEAIDQIDGNGICLDTNAAMQSEFIIFKKYYDFVDTPDKIRRKLRLMKQRSLCRDNERVYQICLSQLSEWLISKGWHEDAEVLLAESKNESRE